MAKDITLDEGTSSKKTETEEVSTNIHRQRISMAGVGACALRNGYTRNWHIHCTVADTNTTTDSQALQSGDKYLIVYCASACVVAMGEATDTSSIPGKGVYVGAGIPTAFPVVYTDGGSDETINVQSPVAGAVVYVTAMRNDDP